MGPDWLQDGVYVGMNQFVRYEFIGTKGDGFQGDIAIDDLNFGQCSPCKYCSLISIQIFVKHFQARSEGFGPVLSNTLLDAEPSLKLI